MGKVHTHYDNLKVSRSAPPEVIKAAYRVLTQKYHPDKHGGSADATQVMRLVNEAYETLMDPAKRAAHDAWIVSEEAAEAAAASRPRTAPSAPAPPPAAPVPPPTFTPASQDAQDGAHRRVAWRWVAGVTAAIAAVVVVVVSHQAPRPEVSAAEAPAVTDARVPQPSVAAEPNTGPLRDSAVTAIGNPAPPVPVFSDTDSRLVYLRWLGAMSNRLQSRVPDWEVRREFLQTLWFESRRAGLTADVVMGLIETTSDFHKFYVADDGARGYMAVSPGWSAKIGDGDAGKLFHLQTNLRFGCVLLRHFLDQRSGDLAAALQDYYSSNTVAPDGASAHTFVHRVFANAQHWAYKDTAPVVQR